MIEQPRQEDVVRQSFAVRYDYDVHFTSGVFDRDNPLLADVLGRDAREPASVFLVIDAGLVAAQPDLPDRIVAYGRAHAGRMRIAGATQIPGGEAAKAGARWVARLCRAMHATGICRHSYVLAVGGGAVLDLAGFAAAIMHRGVRLVRVATTVLAQDDAGVGVKNGVNAFGAKNLLGTFAPPYAVINDARLLATLSPRDWRAGLAEAVKVALLADPELFALIEASAGLLALRDEAALLPVVRRCAELHVRHIGRGDPFERGSGRPLDFGHWAAHRLEQLSAHRLRHGEAVAVGIALDATYSRMELGLPAAAWRRILGVLATLGFDLVVPELDQLAAEVAGDGATLRGLEEFRQHLGGELTVTLLQDIARPVEVHRVDVRGVRRAIRLLRAHAAAPGPRRDPPGAPREEGGTT